MKILIIVLFLFPLFCAAQNSKIENEREKYQKYSEFIELVVDAEFYPTQKVLGVEKVQFQTKDGILAYLDGNIRGKIKKDTIESHGWIDLNPKKSIFVCASVRTKLKNCFFSILQRENGEITELDLVIVDMDKFIKVPSGNNTLYAFKTEKGNFFALESDYKLSLVEVKENSFAFKDYRLY